MLYAVKAAFHDTDIDTGTDSPDTPTSLHPREDVGVGLYDTNLVSQNHAVNVRDFSLHSVSSNYFFVSSTSIDYYAVRAATVSIRQL